MLHVAGATGQCLRQRRRFAALVTSVTGVAAGGRLRSVVRSIFPRGVRKWRGMDGGVARWPSEGGTADEDGRLAQ